MSTGRLSASHNAVPTIFSLLRLLDTRTLTTSLPHPSESAFVSERNMPSKLNAAFDLLM